MKPSSPQLYFDTVITKSKGIALIVSLVKPVAYLSLSYNPYYWFSGTKLQGIVDTVLNLKDRSYKALREPIENPAESECYLVRSMQRFFPSTSRPGLLLADAKINAESEQEYSDLPTAKNK